MNVSKEKMRDGSGYQPTHGSLDVTNPPQGGSGVPRKKGGPEVSRLVIKEMASKIRNGVLDGQDDAWVENWLEVLLTEAGVTVTED